MATRQVDFSKRNIFTVSLRYRFEMSSKTTYVPNIEVSKTAALSSYVKGESSVSHHEDIAAVVAYLKVDFVRTPDLGVMPKTAVFGTYANRLD